MFQPDYPIKYGKPEEAEIIKVVDRIYNYLNESTPSALVDENGNKVSNLSKVDEKCKLESVVFRLTSYEWGVAYAGMLELAKNTGDEKYKQYTIDRLNFLSEVLSANNSFEKENKGVKHSLERTYIRML